MNKIYIYLFAIITLFCNIPLFAHNQDPLPSWNEGANKQAILDFVHATTDKKNPAYVSPAERIATFDQDGTLWVEQPIYTQVIFAFDRVLQLAFKHPEWKTQSPFKEIIAKDKVAMTKFTSADLEKIVIATHSDMSVEAFHQAVKQWISQAKNPRWHRFYTQLVYQPMLEVMQLLQANGYKTYIVTGGGQEFVRVYANQVYHVPPEQIIGSALATKYTYDKRGNGILIKLPQLLLRDNMSGKPEDIYLFIGRHPQAAFGNSTGDQQMLEYTQANKGAHLMMLVHHDDAIREYAYGANSKVGTFSDALMQEAKQRGWQVISMKKDWKRIFSDR